MQWLANISVRRPIFASVLIAVFVVVGLVGYKSLGVDKFPKVDFPLITIITPYPGASPSAVETDVTQRAAIDKLVEIAFAEDARLLDVDDERCGHPPPAKVGADELGGA